MKKNIGFKLVLILIFGLFLISVSSCNKKEEPQQTDDGGNVYPPVVPPEPEPEVDKELISLPYSSLYKESKAYHDSYYSDDYFKANASSYNSRLAIASLAVAMAAYPIKGEDGYSHTKELYGKIGFEKFYKNEYADQNSIKDALGVVMASKKFDTYTLISVNARGSSYGYEWASNFEVGNDGQFAKGFNVASNIVLDTIKKYISDNNITGNVKIWATGYSRAAAAVNLAFGKIDEALINNINLLENVDYNKEDLFVYTFEAPAGKVQTLNENNILEKNESYNNIINIISLDDIVPMVMPKEWGFVRYGIDYYIPSKLTDFDYEDYLKVVKENVKNTYDVETIGEYKIDTFALENDAKINYIFGKYVESLIDDLVDGIGSLDNYVENLEETISQVIGLAITNKDFVDVLIKFKNVAQIKILAPLYTGMTEEDIDKTVNNVMKAIEEEYNAMLSTNAFNSIDKDKFTNSVKELLRVIIKVLKKEGLTALAPLMTWVKSFIYPHIPEIEYASLLALENGDKKYTLNTIYYKAIISSEDDFSIETGGKVIAEYKNNKLTTKLVCEKEEDNYIIYFPFVDEYTILAEYYEVYEMNGKYVEPKIKISGGVC